MLANDSKRSPRELLASSIRYLRVWPGSLTDGRYLAAAYIATVRKFLNRGPAFGSVGFGLSAPGLVRLRVGDLQFYVRPHSEDLAIAAGSHEPDVVRWFHPRAGEVVIDVGAHIGSYALRAARAGSEVIAYEPHPETFRILAANVRLNRFTRVEARNVAVGSTTGEATLHSSSTLTGRASLRRSLPDEVVSGVHTVRLDDELPANRYPRIDWLKIDVEGFEIEALRGAMLTLHRTRRIILEVEHGAEEDCRALLVGQLGFVISGTIRQPTQDYWLLRNPSLN